MATTCQVHLLHIWPVYGRLCTSLPRPPQPPLVSPPMVPTQPWNNIWPRGNTRPPCISQ